MQSANMLEKPVLHYHEISRFFYFQDGSYPPSYYYHYTRLTALFPGLPRWVSTRKENQSGLHWSKRQWVAVASAGPYARLHLAPNRQPCQHPVLYSVLYRLDALPATQPTASKHCPPSCIFELKIFNKYVLQRHILNHPAKFCRDQS